MTRVILELEGDKNLIESLLVDAVESDQIKLVSYYFKEDVVQKSLVADWCDSARELNAWANKVVAPT